MFRSRLTAMSAGATPSPMSWRADARIITSGPHTIAFVFGGSKGTRPSSWVTTPTSPIQPGPARSTVTSTSMSNRLRHSWSWKSNRRSSGERAP